MSLFLFSASLPLTNYHAVLLDEEIAGRFPEITPHMVEVTIRRLRFIGDYVRSPRVRFEYSRDECDQKFIELAIGLKAKVKRDGGFASGCPEWK